MEVNPAETTEAPVAQEQPAVTKEIDESEITPVVPSTGDEETGAGDAPSSEEAVDSSSTDAPVVEEPVANGNGDAAEVKEPETTEDTLKRKTGDGEEETPAEVPEKRLKTADTEEAGVEEGAEGEAEEATA